MKLSLALVLLLLPALPGRADDTTILTEEQPGQAQSDKPAPQLAQLDRALTQKQEAQANGLLTPEQYQDFLVKFRVALDATMARVPPTPENKGLHAQIIARLGEQERGQALAGLEQALEENPTSPPLLRAKGLILYEQKDYPAAAEFARQAWKNSNETDRGALALLKMSEGRTSAVGMSPGVTQGVLPQPQVPAVVAAHDSNKPYRLAVKGTAMPSEVPALYRSEPTAPLYAGRPMYSAATGPWDRAADGLILRGSDWIASADTIGENGFSGVGKFTSKGVGKGMLMAGGLMDALPVAADWTLDKDRRILSGDLTAITDISRGAYSFGKTAVVGFARDTRVAANDWADLLTLRQPTTYQALKATAHTEAILLNFIPVGFAARGGRVVVVETAEVVGVSAARRALARSIALGGRELSENAASSVVRGAGEVSAYEALAACPPGSACGIVSRRPFIPENAGGPIRKLGTDGLKFTEHGIDAVEKHLSRFKPAPDNKVMIERLRAISRGELQPTQADINFYAHELREYVRYRRQGFPTGQGENTALWNDAHTATLEDYRINERTPNALYHPNAEAARINE